MTGAEQETMMSTLESLGKSLDETAAMLDARLERDAATIAKLTAERDELLVACREAYNAAMYLFSIEGGQEWSGLAKQLHDAIAKATGETSAP
jgi:hypothetical protein